ncbi:hypothetical protein CAI21_17615 [Alkalilimnicola ehrlichii]|uniref:Uncharacterized protein n=1 Tax=Alkalilimnicola ehrlichii TaxID=351052 RepID=A0A3E0WKA1_9GAMM|nr:hypothetical protein [Alkalilimnicola ehrlichii]RFA26149.1 hypothetical protein CAI21_17615 [Alkalilimnicola ehrlichii]RFA32355.1 hypothetical protein CAL65_19925 [Alkalilimnicola ehrlichii]
MNQLNGQTRALSRNPFLQILSLIGAVLLLTAAVFIGAFLFAALLGLLALAAIILYVRIWWFGRQWRKRKRAEHDTTAKGQIIEGEYKYTEQRTSRRQRER